MDSKLTLAQRFYLVGRMLQMQPTPEELQAFVQTYPGFDALDAAEAEEAAQDHLRLFVGLGTPLAPPWESTWASDARLLFQRETLDVRYWYRSFGLQAAALHHEPDDHVGLELEFIACLLERGECDAACAFAAGHPLAWVARWNAAVQGAARTRFYRQLAAEVLCLLESLRPEG